MTSRLLAGSGMLEAYAGWCRMKSDILSIGFDGDVVYEMCLPLRGGGSEANLDRTAALSLRRTQELIAGGRAKARRP